MKYLYIRSDTQVRSKPEWLDAFRTKYDEPYPYHMSLKRVVEITDEEAAWVSARLHEIAKRHTPFEVTFSDVIEGKTGRGHVIMILAKNADKLHALRNEVYETCKEFTKYQYPEYAGFDATFNPHLTIARHLTDERLKEARAALGSDTSITVLFNSLTFCLNPRPDAALS